MIHVYSSLKQSMKPMIRNFLNKIASSLYPTNPHAWWRYGLIVLALMALFYFLVHTCFDNLDASGTFGDTFGAINAFFTGLAFAGFLIALALQRKDLQNQQEELRLQRKELKLQRREMAETREVFQFQRNDMLLTTLLDHFNKQFNSITPTVETLKCIRWVRISPEDRELDWQLIHYHLDSYRTEYLAACQQKYISDFSLLMNGNYNEVAKRVAIQLGIWDSLNFIHEFVAKNYQKEEDRTFYSSLVKNAIPKEAQRIWFIANAPLPSPLLPMINEPKLHWNGFGLISVDQVKGIELSIQDGWKFGKTKTTVCIDEKKVTEIYTIYPPAEQSLPDYNKLIVYLPQESLNSYLEKKKVSLEKESAKVNFDTFIELQKNEPNTPIYNLYWKGKIEVMLKTDGLWGSVDLEYPKEHEFNWGIPINPDLFF